MTTNDERQQIANHVRELEGHQVKSLVLKWLAATDASLTDFEKMLSTDYAKTHSAETWVHGELDRALNFQPMTEDRMAQWSLDALEEYRNSGNGFSQERLQEWADRLVSNPELLCSQ